jgi:hypothetical protein
VVLEELSYTPAVPLRNTHESVLQFLDSIDFLPFLEFASRIWLSCGILNDLTGRINIELSFHLCGKIWAAGFQKATEKLGFLKCLDAVVIDGFVIVTTRLTLDSTGRHRNSNFKEHGGRKGKLHGEAFKRRCLLLCMTWRR